MKNVVCSVRVGAGASLAMSLLLVGVSFTFGGCPGGGAPAANGGKSGGGGTAGSGGAATGSGGAVSGTGGAATGSGGAAVGGSGGTAVGSGGVPGNGSGGTIGSGGSTIGSGGAAASGGAAGGNGGGAGTGGSTATGGAANSGGAPGTGGAGGIPATCTAAWTGTARPLLTDASAACYTIQRYLAQTGTVGALTTDNWNPSAGLAAASTFTANYTVATDGSGTQTTIQAAVSAAKAAGGTARKFILVKPGTYRELVCVDGTVPITLYGADTDNSKVTIVFDNYNAKTVDTTKTNACSVPTATTYGTSGSSTFFVKAAGFQAMNLTISNDFDEGTMTTGLQAVALTTQADQVVLQNVHVVGNQDTLQVKTGAATKVVRVYLKNSFIDGDTDFIFGNATAVFDGCTITYVAGRKNNSTHISPSTEMPNPFGFLIINSKMLGAAGISGTTYLGRAWDDSSATVPNGQAIIRNTEIGSQINVATPWTVAATTSRAFDATTNRLYEYKNTGPGAAP